MSCKDCMLCVQIDETNGHCHLNPPTSTPLIAPTIAGGPPRIMGYVTSHPLVNLENDWCSRLVKKQNAELEN